MNNNQQLQIKIVYDNNPFDKNLEQDWGFSCYMTGLEKTILFDTGKNGDILLSNMGKLGINPEEIDLVFLSHFHKDHTNGLDTLLRYNPGIEVWIPEFFPSDFRQAVKAKGAAVKNVYSSKMICAGAYTSGVIPGWIEEQSLILDTPKGLILITGCAHPRVVKIISTVKELFHKNIYMIFGGFHLSGFTAEELKEIIVRFRAYGVQKVGPCHCSGDKCRQIFADEYKDDFIEIGAGKEIKV